MSLESRTSVESVRSLVDQINRGEIALPAFQRDFDWGPNDVRSLLATVLMGWPAGALLLAEGAIAHLQVRPFDHGPTPLSPPPFLVLDGQQRLTALWQALTGVGRYRYALTADAGHAESVEELEREIHSFTQAQWTRLTSEPTPMVAGKIMVPCSVLGSADAFFKWESQIDASLRLHEAEDQLGQLTRNYDSGLRRLAEYEFPLVIVNSAVPTDDVARIFERVNRTGLQLGAFDLAVARVFEEHWDLRDRWEDARLEYPALEEFFGEDGLAVLQAISLRVSGDVRRSAVLDLSRTRMHADWSQAVRAMNDGVEFLRDHCGVWTPGWLPFSVMVVPLAALAYTEDLERHLVLLRKWFFSRAFSLRFDVAANTRVVEDFNEIRYALDGGSLASTPASGDAILTATRRSSGAVWRAFMCAIAANGGRDLSGAALAPLARHVSAIVVAPFFSREDTEGTDAFPRVLNQVLSVRSTARTLRKVGWRGFPPSLIGATDEPIILESQFLPPNPESLTVQDVLEARAERLGRFLAEFADQRMELDPVARTRSTTPVSPADSAALMRQWEARLRTEYILSHENVPTGVRTGTDPIPSDWLVQRLTQLGLLDLFTHYAGG